MDKLTQEVRLENWTSIIEQCESRPEGQSKKEWLDLNGISEKQYYYWLRKIRRLTAERTGIFPIKTSPAAVQFAELPLSGPEMIRQTTEQPFSISSVAIMIRTDNIFVQISDSVSPDLAGRIIKAVSHAI